MDGTLMRQIHTSCVLAVLILVLAACGGNPIPSGESVTPSGEATTTTEASRGTLRMAHEIFWGGAESLDPASPVVFYDAIRSLYDTLVVLDESYQPIPALATAWEPNDDATVWTFTLRDDVLFHDGRPFTSADVVYTFERLLVPDSASPMSSMMAFLESIEAVDVYTVVFTLAQPHAELPILLASGLLSIIPADSGETIGTIGIGTGPFKLEHLDATGTSRLVAYDDHWRGPPGLAAIELIGIADSDARIQALQAGQVDLVLSLAPQQASLLRNNADLVVQQFPSGGWMGISMRTDTPPFDDVRVRQAMRLLVDRQQMVDLLLQGVGTVVCDTPVWSGDPYFWEGSCLQDIDRARALLAEAGYPDGLDVTLYTSNSLPLMLQLAEIYQQQAADAGINVTIEQVPADTYWTDVWMVESLIITGDVQNPADHALNLYFRADSPYNETHWDDAETERLLDAARAELDPAKRTALYQEVQQLLAEEGGGIIGFQQDELRAFASSIAGVEPVTRFDLLWYGITKTE